MRQAFLVAAVCLGLGAGPARADMITYDLTTFNVAGFTGPFASVTVDLTSSTVATITFDSLTNGGNTYLFHTQGAAAVNVNGTATVSNITAINTFLDLAPRSQVTGVREMRTDMGTSATPFPFLTVSSIPPMRLASR